LSVRVTAPRDIACGQYVLKNGRLAAEKTDPVRAELTVNVNDFEVTDENGDSLEGPLSFYPVKGKAPLVRKLRVFAVSGDLEPDKVDIEQGRAVLNDTNSTRPGFHIRWSDKREVRHRDRLRTGVEFGLDFETPGAPFEPYSGGLVIRSEDLHLRKEVVYLVQWVELVKPTGAAQAGEAKRGR
jgi:hypothetical protein